MKNSVESVENAAEKKERRNIKVMDLILVIVGVSLLVFTIVMIQLFKVYGTVPDTLITCVFATLGGECGIMGWIKTTKDRNRERKWEQEDKQEAKIWPRLLFVLNGGRGLFCYAERLTKVPQTAIFEWYCVLKLHRTAEADTCSADIGEEETQCEPIST